MACGNTINLYSLTTNILIATLRSKRQQAALSPEKAKVTHGDVHKGMIIAMEIVEDKKIVSLCSRGVLAEWDLKA